MVVQGEMPEGAGSVQRRRPGVARGELSDLGRGRCWFRAMAELTTVASRCGLTLGASGGGPTVVFQVCAGRLGFRQSRLALLASRRAGRRVALGGCYVMGVLCMR
jgi:hypothetical protein